MNRNYITTVFPEIRKIHDKVLRGHVIDVWLLAMKRGGWEKIENIPFTLLINTERTLVEHTRAVTRMAMSIAEERHVINMDIVIAGGLVHDVGKLLEYTQKQRQVVRSDYGTRVRHPISGYALAREAGLPEEVAHIIATHSTEGEKVKRSPESIIIHHCDFIDFDIEKSK